MSPTERPGRRPGRRPRAGDTRERILAAASATFGERGFDGATIREIAAGADVNPALVLYYFGSKQRLFIATMELPAELGRMVPTVLAGPRDGIGERFIRFMLDLWDAPATRPQILGLVRSATTDPLAAAMLRQMLIDGPVLALANAVERPDARLRATLVGSQLVGLALARYVVAVEPLASADRETLIRVVAPTLQRYLTDDLTDEMQSTHARAWAGGP